MEISDGKKKKSVYVDFTYFLKKAIRILILKKFFIVWTLWTWLQAKLHDKIYNDN